MDFPAHTDLDGRIAVVTGASSGIGAAIARRLADHGARVALLARRADRLDAVATECGGLAVVADVSDHGSLTRAAATVRDRLGPVDLVVANAGFLLVDPLLDEAPERLADLVATNVTGTTWTARLFTGDLTAAAAAGRRADLVFVGSPAGGAWSHPLMGLYGTTKAAVHQLSVIMRGELAPRGVRVHTVEPSWTLTELTDAYAAGLTELAGRAPELLANVPAPDPAVVPLTPADVAAVVAYTVSAPIDVNIAYVSVAPTRLA